MSKIMKNLKATLSYDGTRYNGWQRQKNSKNTIQEVIEKVISEVLDENIEIIASGRTDAGVHANGQVINFKTENNLNIDELRDIINTNLPNDISFNKIEEVDNKFHSRYNVKSKVYVYKILNSKIHDPFLRKYIYQYTKELDINKMIEASKLFLGTHDFKGFSSGKKTKKSTIRTIYDIDIKIEGNEISIFYHGDGFLYNMVRIMTGTLLEIANGNLDKNCITEIFDNQIRSEAGFTVPPHGLFLLKVIY